MSPRRTILVSYDFDGSSEAALRVGADLAARSNRRLAVLHVSPTVAEPDSSTYRELRLRLEELAPARSEILVASGDPVARLVAYADHAQPDRIVMGTHQRGGLGRAWHGSVVQGVTRESMTPVLTVPASASDAVCGERMIDCAIDFGPGTAAAIELAHEHARDMDAGLRLVHVVEAPPRMTTHDVEVSAPGLGSRLADLAKKVRATTSKLLHGNAAEVILASARTDLPLAIVISGRDPTHASWGTRSVASRVVGGSPVPVLIVPGRVSFGWRRGSRPAPVDSAAP